MNVRPLRQSDVPRLHELFLAQNIDYEFPPIEKLLVHVLVDDKDEPIMAVAARKTAELYLLCDPGWRTPAWRWEALLKLHEAVRKELERQDYDDVHIWIPPQLKSFGKRLMRKLGWSKPLWECFSRSTHG